MGGPPTGTTVASWERQPGETSWDRITRLRQLRSRLDREITADTRAAVTDAKAAGLKVTELAKMWHVTAAWIYTVAPARPKGGGRSRQNVRNAQ
jgi:hypothetical protein